MVIPPQIWPHDHCKTSQHTRLSCTNKIMKMPKTVMGIFQAKYLKIQPNIYPLESSVIKARLT